MSELEELYSRISDGVDIQNLTNLILEIYENPDCILEVFNILATNRNKKN